MTTPCWLARVDAAPAGAWACARLDGDHGCLAAWRQDEQPVGHALQADPRAFDPEGAAAWISLAWAPPGFALLYDDPAVQRARQAVLEQDPAAAVTTLMRDGSHIGGALTARRGADAARRLRDDPFARLLPTAVFEVGPGLIGTPAPPGGPVTERYGGAPWPVDRFVTSSGGARCRVEPVDVAVAQGGDGRAGLGAERAAQVLLMDLRRRVDVARVQRRVLRGGSGWR